MGASITKPQQDQSKRLEHCNAPESSAVLHSTYGEPVLLNLGRRVFLSHSGRDKDFVRRLNKDLRRSYNGIEVTFFDEETLPKGKPISMEKSIVEAAKGSALGVLVLTDDFFMHTPNPMLELEAFVAGSVDLLPLFFTLSVEEFKEKKRWDRWEKKWKEWAAADDKLAIENWRSYLKIVRTYSGLEYCKIVPDGRQDLYIDEVVKQVARIIGPAVPLCGADVYGKGRLCRAVDDMYKMCTFKRSLTIDHTPAQIASACANLGLWEDSGLYAYDVVGIHGFPGLGKTTLCKCLCDFYFGELSGKVCYIDVGLLSESRLSRMQHVLFRLDRGNTKDVRNLRLDSNQVENMLKERLSSMKDRVFLAIDNILPETESREEALIYLGCKFPKGSKILITSKTESTLRNLMSLLPNICSFSRVIEYMPALEFNEARDIFEHKFPALHNCRGSSPPAIDEKIQRDVDACVNKCTIFKGKRYHPLMLQSLAAFVKWDELMSSLDWKGRLAKVASEGVIHKDDAWDQVFQVFDITYRLSAEEAKKVFLDLALCDSAVGWSVWFTQDRYGWIEMLHQAHNIKEREMEKILLRLHNFCFIVKEGRTIKIQDLMVEFGKHKAGADPDGYVVLEDIAHGAPVPLPTTARHVSIARCRNALRTLDLRAVEGVTVLHLLDNAGLEEVLLSHSSSAHLRSLIVSVPPCTALRFIVNEDWNNQSVRCLALRGNLNFCSQPASTQHSLVLPDARMDILFPLAGDFRNLGLLTLNSATLPSISVAQSIDLTPCPNLKQLVLSYLPGLKSIRVPESSSRLADVQISHLPHLEKLAFAVLAPNLKTSFSIWDCVSLQRVSLTYTTPSISAYANAAGGRLSFYRCPRLAIVGGLSQYRGEFGLGVFDFSAMHCVIPPLNVEALRQRITGPRRIKGEDNEFGIKILKSMVTEMDAGIDISRCKAEVTHLEMNGYDPAEHCRLGALKALCLKDTQHIGPLLSALFQAKLTNLQELEIQCREGCGCDQSAPNFSCTVPIRVLKFWCPQVRDLATFAQAPGVQKLSLRRCTSVEVWPDFGAMTSLVILDLRDTSLKGWPARVQQLPHLKYLLLQGCRQLPAKELILGAITSDHQCSWIALASLRDDLGSGRRDMRTVADALGALSAELVELFDRWSPEWEQKRKSDILWLVLDLMYEIWFGGRKGSDYEEQKQYIRAKMRGLLISESFLLLPFRVCRRCLSEKRDLEDDNKLLGIREIVVLGIALVGGASSAYSSYCALPAAVNDHCLRDSTIVFLINTCRSLIQSCDLCNLRFPEVGDCGLFGFMKDRLNWNRKRKAREAWFDRSDEQEKEVLRGRVEVGLCTMAREAGLQFEE